MGGFFQFARKHLVPIIGIIFAALAWGYSVVSTGLEVATAVLPGWGWQLVAGIVFVTSVVAILFHWDTQQNSHKTGATPSPMGPPLETRPQGGVIPPTVTNWNPNGLYVGEIHVDANHLARDYYLEIAIRVFNAVGTPIDIRYQRGVIGCRRAIADGEESNIGLPPPQILHDRSPVEGRENLSEVFIVLGQRVPREIAEIVVREIDEGRRPYFDLDTLDLIAVVNPTGDTIRLPLWNGFTLRRETSAILAGRNFNMRVEAATFSIGGVGTPPR